MALNSLKNKKDFERVFKKGRGLKKDFLFLKFIQNNLDKSRFGIIVSQKTAKKAVARNKIRRRIKAILRGKLAELKKGFDIVIVASPGSENKSFPEIKKTLNELFSRRF